MFAQVVPLKRIHGMNSLSFREWLNRLPAVKSAPDYSFLNGFLIFAEMQRLPKGRCIFFLL
jgi:hypothetical protein